MNRRSAGADPELHARQAEGDRLVADRVLGNLDEAALVHVSVLSGRGPDSASGVTLHLRDLGEEAIEVRQVLAHDAPDEAVTAYAQSQQMALVTHDRGCARRARSAGLQHLWLRTNETHDRDRLRQEFPDVRDLLEGGAVRVTLFARVIRTD